MAKEAIITSKKPMTEAETTSGPTVAVSRKLSRKTKGVQGTRREVHISEHAAVRVMRKVRQLK